MKLILRIFGFIVVRWDTLFGISSRKKKILENNPNDILDHTGKIVNSTQRIKNISSTGEIVFPNYKKDFSHALWRAQELTLLNNIKKQMKQPILDLGCGDGSFSSLIFDKIDYGVDPDQEALQLALQYKVYQNTICSFGSAIDLKDNCIGSVFSNSVLEHVDNLDSVVREILRILVPGGLFIITVPSAQLTIDMCSLFGEKEAIRINKDYYHKNLFTETEWRNLLSKNHFSVTKVIRYQPRIFTFIYRLLGTKVIRRIFRTIIYKSWNISEKYIIALIKSSISTAEIGGNMMIFAYKNEEIK